MFRDALLEGNGIEAGLKKLGFKKTKSGFGADIWEDKSENKVFVVDGKIDDTDIDDKNILKKVKEL